MTSAGKHVEELEFLYIAGRNVKQCSPSGKQFGSPSELNTELEYYPKILLLAVYSKELKAETQRDTCTPMFIIALFKIATKWEQP